jgi:shikimate kinase
MRQPSVIALHPAPVDRRIALALHAAQGAAISVPGLASIHAEPPAKPRTVAEIVEMAERRGWSQVFKALKSNGLLVEQTLGHVVARWRESAGRADLLS